ncbi:hypothetical protein HYPSUDRAFT_226229 [Hypholoma sublateritium FD-334 SS-4]|uniref:Thioesterase domain-containing protein n=1 Tax=Hypholoma sublateritium (strain FD-334 SS-4) TaxID=945553 RepID=A0A0D2QDF5_HYPSF|nr:hypothetical protein HYPSUDRAFT_226229 [Hypholoma sublateritium FD-334 SS-4]
MVLFPDKVLRCRGSAIALLLMKILEGGDDQIGVSQTFNMFFYQPVPAAGERLRIISRSVSTDNGSGSCICEVDNEYFLLECGNLMGAHLLDMGRCPT